MIAVCEEGLIRVETKSLYAELKNGNITLVKSKLNGETYLDDSCAESRAPLQLVYAGNERVDLNPNCRNGSMEMTRFSDYRVDIRFSTWNGAGMLSIQEDLETGDLILVRACGRCAGI